MEEIYKIKKIDKLEDIDLNTNNTLLCLIPRP